MRPKLRIRQTIENRKWVYRIQRRRWLIWFNTHDPAFRDRGEAQERVLDLRAEYEYDGVKPWVLTG